MLFPTSLVAQSDCGTNGSSTPAAHYSHAQLRGIGRHALAQQVEHYGRVSDVTDRRDVSATLARLINATGAPLDVQWELVRNPEINASALPGGILVVNEGLVKKFRDIASTEGHTAAERNTRFTGYLAAVLGHELAHITLGHSDSLANERLRCPAAQMMARRRVRVDTLNADEEQQLAAALASSDLRESAGSRADESAADRVGALYMLRAGWTIQQAMDLFRHFDEMEHSDHDGGLQSLTWLLDHPRASQREAALEQFRGQLKMHQAEFDDALLLVQHGVLLDSAITMLDRVLADFPSLVPARHARAAALQEMWMETAPPSARQVQTTVPTYEASFIGSIRTAGSVGDPALLDSARREYRRVLAIQTVPFALSNLAVLDAYAGSSALALARADSAARMLPQSLPVVNNRAAVLYLTGDIAGARMAWTAMSHRTAAPIIQFNLARAALAAGDRAAATPLLTEYAGADADSPWGREAARLLGRTPAAPSAGGNAATRTGLSSSRVAGVQLGMSADDIVGVLGRPDSTEDVRGGSLLHYASKGLSIGVAGAKGAVIIVVASQAAGPADGVTVRDPLRSVSDHWGSAIASRDNQSAYDRGGWVGVVEATGSRVGRLALRTK